MWPLLCATQYIIFPTNIQNAHESYCIIHSAETGGVGRSPTRDEKNGNSKENKDVDLPVGTLEKMKDLMISVEKAAAMLETGLKNDDIFSTNAEDYLDVDLKNKFNKDEGYLENHNLFRE